MERASHESIGTGGVYERRDMNLSVIGTFLAALVVTVLVVLLLMGWLFGYLQVRDSRRQAQPSPLAEPHPAPSGPLLQVTPRQDLKTMRAEEEALLHSFGWVDRPAGIVRIPIGRAMKLLVERGLPAETGKAGR